MIKAFVQYICIGFVGLSADILSMKVGMVVFDLYHIVAALISGLVGLTVNFVLNSRYNFKKKISLRAYLHYLAFALLAFSVGLLLQYILVDMYGIGIIIARIIAIASTTILSFSLNYCITFSEKKYSSTWYFLVSSVLIGGLVASIPLLILMREYGGIEGIILPKYTKDFYYYFTLIKEAAEGNFSLGNPFIKEYSAAKSPTIVLPVLFASWFGVLGDSVNVIHAVNLVFYGACTGGLFFLLAKQILKRNAVALICAVLGLVTIWYYMIRPVSMQTIYPIFLAYMSAFYIHLKAPHSFRKALPLLVISVFSFYYYFYLWMLIYASLGIYFIYCCIDKNSKRLRNVATNAAIVVLASIPGVLKIQSSYADLARYEAMDRIGILESHLPSPMLVLNAKYLLVVVLVALVMVWKRKDQSKELLLLLFVSSGLLMAGLSNVFSGKEVEFSSHFARFMIVLVPLFGFYFMVQIMKKKSYVALIGLVFFLGLHTAEEVKGIRLDQIGGVAQSQERYLGVIKYINESIEGGAVIFADRELSPILPIYTRSYVFYAPRAHLNTMLSDDVVERYLATTLIHGISFDRLVAETREYYGTKYLHQANKVIRRALYCEWMTGGQDCEEKMDPKNLLPRGYHEELMTKGAKIEGDIVEVLKNADVNYILLPHNNSFPVNRIAATELYEDLYYKLYKVDR